MTKNKSTKRALLSSVIALLLCFTMLLGTTFAWFTDNASTGVNTIKSGTLDVKLVDADGNDLEGKTLNFKKAAGAPAGEELLWEPGVTYELDNFQIKNNGNLALKYQIVINGINGSNKLMEVIDFKISIGNTQNIDLDSFEGHLKPGQSSSLVKLVGHMSEDANNDYQNLTADGISITVYATQDTVEYDSYNNTYDANATYDSPALSVNGVTYANMEDALKNGTPDGDGVLTIDVAGNISWETGAQHGSTPFVVPEGTTKIILNGISDEATLTATGKGVGPVGHDTIPVEIYNMTIADRSESYAEDSWEFGYLEFRGDVKFVNCDIINGVMMEGTNAVFENCSLNSNDEDKYAAWIYNGDASFSNCYVTGARGLKVHADYGSAVGKVTIDGCTFENLTKKPGVAIGTGASDNAVTIQKSKFINTQPGDQSNYICETDGPAYISKNNEVVAPVNVGTAEELIALGNKSQNAIINLTADIDLNGAEFQAIGAAYGKTLIVNGNGHTISNAKLAAGTHNGMDNYGLFYAYTNSSLTISDLTIEGVTVEPSADNYNAAVVVGYADGGSTVTLTNVDVVDSSVKNTYASAAIYVGYTTGKVNLTDCDVAADCSVQGKSDSVTAAYVGTANTTGCTVTVENCTNGMTTKVVGRNINGTATILIDGNETEEFDVVY